MTATKKPMAPAQATKGERFHIWCQATGPFPSMWYGQSVEGWSPADAGSVVGEMWSAASREEADAKALALKQESGSHTYHVLRYGDFGLPKGTPLTSAERAAVVEDMIANPEKYKRLAFERARRECPWMTEEQHENEWQFVVELLGL